MPRYVVPAIGAPRSRPRPSPDTTPQTMDNLTFDQLAALLDSVFALGEGERWLTIMVDLPDDRVPDTDAWRDRRRIAGQWFDTLQQGRDRLPFSDLAFCVYPNAGSNNNDLPSSALLTDGLPADSAAPRGRELALVEILTASSVVLAPTQLSATAPLKMLAREHGFRGASMPGFSRAMIPALALDYDAVDARVREFKDRLDRASGAQLLLDAEGTSYASFFDLRFRTAHASGGLMREPGMVGNLPSGEAYIVPYEGEREGEPSRTAGELPVQFGDEVVVYRLEGNRAVEVLSAGPASDGERQLLAEEPAYGNMAEVGLGVLGDWGVEAVGSTLLDEKLGLHIAFGRSEHFGGVTSPASFRSRDRVVHIDRVYVESVQPLVAVRDLSLVYEDGARETLMADGRYVV
jgi:hypothetical protein